MRWILAERVVCPEPAPTRSAAERRVRDAFSRASLAEIEAEVKRTFSKTVEFVSLPEAAEFRQSVALRENRVAAAN